MSVGTNEAYEKIPFNTGVREVTIRTCKNSFRPNKVSEAFIRALPPSLESMMVYDIGSGGGILAIAAADRKAREVHAVEPAIANYRHLVENIKVNGLNGLVIPHLGYYFDPLIGIEKADFISADVSGIPDTFGRALGWYPEGVATGGVEGYEITCELLRRAPEHIKKTGTLVFPVANDLLDYNKILDVAHTNFGRIENALCSEEQLEEWRASEEAESAPWRSPEYVWFQLRESNMRDLNEAYQDRIPETIHIQEFNGLRGRKLRFWRGQIYKVSEPITAQ